MFGFALAGNPKKPIVRINSLQRDNGASCIKATCRLHHNCTCWVRKAVKGKDRNKLFRTYLTWAVAGMACVETAEHEELALDIKRSYGMAV